MCSFKYLNPFNKYVHVPPLILKFFHKNIILNLSSKTCKFYRNFLAVEYTKKIRQ